jgi:hypothetical protein
MAHYLHSSLFIATVTKWQVPGQKRVLDDTNGTAYLLNTNSLDGIRVKTATKSSLYYFDNPFDHRDNSHYMELLLPVNDYLQVLGLIHWIDASMTHFHVTLPILPKDDPAATAVDHGFKLPDIAFARNVAYVSGQTSDTHSYVWIRADEGWRVTRYLVDLSIAEILALVA